MEYDCVLGTHFKKLEEDMANLDRMYPNRHKEIHTFCCKRCPSDQNRRSGDVDPETEDLKALPKNILAKEYLFVCAWRESKLCKGLCDDFGIDQEYLNKLP